LQDKRQEPGDDAEDKRNISFLFCAAHKKAGEDCGDKCDCSEDCEYDWHPGIKGNHDSKPPEEWIYFKDEIIIARPLAICIDDYAIPFI